MTGKAIYFLNSTEQPEISEVGGKGYSLIKLSSLNLNVPNGIVLTVNFFEPWVNRIKHSDLYQQFMELLGKDNKDPKAYRSVLDQLKEWCLNNLVLAKEQKESVEESLRTLFPNEYDSQRYAIRSSSPEEDLSEASFSGNYETYLGINFDSIEQYVLKSFVSCLDYRVFKYKLEKGMNGSVLRIAIVIMKLITCDVAGVGFSINPMNNDYDEVVINSNFGLGESVVGGIITPDEYIVNKFSKSIVSQKLGSKEKIIQWQEENPNETTMMEQTESHRKQSTLDEEFLIKIVDTILDIEKHYGMPIDIEFGIKDRILYLLQARPITAYNRIPKELLTGEGEKRQLYFDVTLTVQGFEKPMSTLGASILKVIFHYMGMKIFGSRQIDDIRNSVLDSIGGKLLINVSNFSSKVPIKSLANFSGHINNQVPNIISEHGEAYRNEQVCHEINVTPLGMAWRLPIHRMIFYKFFASSTKRNLDGALDNFKKRIEEYVTKDKENKEIPVLTLLETMADELTTIIRDNFVPALFTAVARGYFPLTKLMETHFKDKPELKKDSTNLTKSLPYITILMGLDLYALSKHLDKEVHGRQSQDEFYQDFLDKKFPEAFYQDFDLFLEKYGHRGEGELDIENERYAENPRPLLDQIYTSIQAYDENHNPQKDYDDTNKHRPETFKKLYDLIPNPKEARAFEEAYQLTLNFLHYRESPKYYIILVISKIKEIIMERSARLLEKNLIHDPHDIYKLTIDHLSQWLEQVDTATPERIAEQIKEDNALKEQFDSWQKMPIFFDSRGRYLTSERKRKDQKKNELYGDSVSYGKVRGKAKVMNSVNEKEFYPGEILITKATDPGWTPLIINCGAIVLEIGGMLQHGALVSREFNKPCIVGIEKVTSLIKDGEEVEVDAIEGVVRLLDRTE